MTHPLDSPPLTDRPIDSLSEDDPMNAQRMKVSKIAHAMAYVDTFMMSNDPDECELRKVFEFAHNLSSQEVVAIIKESTKRQTNVFGIKTILKEMDMPEFAQYIQRKLIMFRDSLMEDD